MKKIYNILALAAVTTGLSSCVNNWLDQTPSNGTPTSSAITNYNDARTAMYGMYDGLQGNSTYTQYYAARMFYYGDVRGTTCRHALKVCAPLLAMKCAIPQMMPQTCGIYSTM